MTIDDLAQQRDAIPDDAALPASTTRADLAALQQRRRDLDRRLLAARTAMATLAALPNVDALHRWRDQLTHWRQTLCTDLLTITAPARGATMSRQRNLTLSIRCIDVGVGVLENTGYDLTSLRLGALMIADGYAITGADPARNFLGALPWHGALKEIDRHLAAVDQRRRVAQAHLDAALEDDAVRAAREADATELRDAANAMRIKVTADTNGHTLGVFDGENAPIDEATLTPLQKRALTMLRHAFAPPAPAPAPHPKEIPDGSQV